jgi:uncharacterized repeat protein (TIGR01451 family)
VQAATVLTGVRLVFPDVGRLNRTRHKEAVQVKAFVRRPAAKPTRRRLLVVAQVLLVGLSAVALVSASAGGAARRAATGSVGMGPAHWFGPDRSFGTFGKVPARPATAPLGPVDNLTNPGNNEIMPTTNTYVVFWLPAGYHYSGGTTPASDTAYENTILKYFQDVGGSQILNTTTQYSGTNGTPADTSSFQTSIVDTTAFPHAGTSSDPVTQSDLNTEVFNQITANTWPLGLSTMYFVFLPNNVVDCNHAPPGANCNTNKYCAYHTYGWSGSDTPANDFVWADIPDNRSVETIGGCGDSNVTGNESADTTLSSTEHEHMEAITDPRLNAWQDSTGAENGDKCNREMGVADASSTIANNYLGAGNADLFRIQREWSNKVSGCAASYTTTGSDVESPVPSGTDVIKSVAEATIAGNPSDNLDYTLTFTNPSNQDDAFNVTVTDTLPPGVQSGGSGTVSLDLGDLAPHQSVTQTFTAHPTGPLPAGTTLTNSATFDFNDSTGTAQPSITRTASTTVVNSPPTLNPLPDPQSVDYHDSLSFNVSATDPDAGDTLTLSASGLPAGLSLTDHGDGTATVSGTATAVPGDYTVTISVDDHHNPPVSAQMTIHVLREQTTTTYTGPTVIAQGQPVTLKGLVLEDGTTAPSPAVNVTLSVGAQSCVGTTDLTGLATCTIPSVTVSQGSEPLAAVFSGDTYYLPSADNSQTATVFAFLAKGAFALGDQTVAAASPSTLVTWWGSSWSALNSLSGGAAPDSFKGFAGHTGAQPPACGGTWRTRTGNSSKPPSAAGIPAYMGVVVPGTITKSGSTISGNIAHIVVVQTNPGYAPDPGHPGTGTIVATYC